MRKLVFVISMLLAGLTANAQSKPFSDSTWQLTFHDEFDSTAINPNRWWGTWGGSVPPSYQVYYDWLTTNTWDTITNEDILPYVTPNFQNCNVSGGSVKIRSKKEHRDSCKVWDRWVWDDCWVPGQFVWCPIDSFVSFNYTTGFLMSKDRFKYGYYEIRMKMPDPVSTYANKGLGPNFWFYHRNDTCIWSEIDVFEFGGYSGLDHLPNFHTSNIHYQKYEADSFGTLTTNPADTTHTFDYSSLGSINFSNNYQTFGINWLPDRVEYYHNNVLYKTTTLPSIFPNKLIEMYMFIEMKHPTTNFATLVDTAQTVFPFTYDVDYVRCWQYKQHCDSILNICNFNYASFDPAVYKRITAGGSGCSALIPGSKSVSFHANDYVILQEGFEVGSTSDFLADVTACPEYVNPNSRLIAPQVPDPFDSPFRNTDRLKKKRP